jgi:hypothetical protein
MLIILLDMRISRKELVNSVYYWEVFQRLRENVRGLRPEFWRRKNRLLHHDNASPRTSHFTTDFFYQKQYGCRPPSTILFSASPIEDNPLTEQHFQDAFKKEMQKRWERCMCAEGDLFEGDVGQ